MAISSSTSELLTLALVLSTSPLLLAEERELPDVSDPCVPGATGFNDCLSELAAIGLPMFGSTWGLVSNCGDENPLLELIAAPDRLPLGRNRQLLKEERKRLASLDLIEEVFASMQQHSTRVLQLAMGYGYACFVRGSCAAQSALSDSLREGHGLYLASSAALLQSALSRKAGQRLPWPAGLADPASAIARHAFDARHLDFAKSVVNGLQAENLEPIRALGALHDLALRLATSNCELQAELLAHATLSEMVAPEIVTRVSFAQLPRFEFSAGSCCRRYHVLTKLLEPLVQGRTDPFRVLEVGVNNAITSEYILSKFPEVEFDGVDPYLNAEDVLEEASARLQRFGSRARLWRMTSEAAAPTFAEGTFDFVFIDGDHSREAVAADLRVWRQRVRPGGLLAGHDLFNLAFEGVLEALLEDLANRYGPDTAGPVTVHFAPDFVWWIQL